ncbi:MAG TPA: MFS transporter [Anaerolineales bacterium]|nr:MFS transporter [Anaerolineales bacterium]HLO29440.1 MFS transporter [Anaerolineales bacterium]
MNTFSRKNIFILSFTLLVVMLGYSMAMPLLPFYIERFGVGGRELGWLMSTYALMQLLCAPVWGIISDRYGRKPILAIGVLGYTITLFLFGLAENFIMLFLARTLSGILSSATQPTAMAYIGESTEQKEKSKGMGQLGAMVGLGVILGPLFGGLLSSDSLSLPFFVGSGLAFIALLLVIFLLPESKTASSKTVEVSPSIDQSPMLQSDSASPTSKRLSVFDIYLRILLSPAGILLLLIFIMSFGMTNFQGMIGLYAVDKFAFNTKQVGAIWMVMGGVLILGQGVLVGPLSKKFGDLPLIKIGLFGGALGFVLVALAVDYITTLLALGLFILGLALIGPALNSYISNFAGEHQGTVMGLNSAFTSLGRVIGPLWGGYIYDINIEYPFFSGAATLLLGLLVGIIGLRKKTADHPIPG